MKFVLAWLLVLVLVLTFPLSVMAATSEDDSGGTSFLEILKSAFIPSENYFQNQISSLNEKVNKKLGGVADLYNIIKNFLDTLNSGIPEADFTFTIPDNLFYKGYKGVSGNIFDMAGPYIKFGRDVFSSFLYLTTAVTCYHKMRTFFSESAT